MCIKLLMGCMLCDARIKVRYYFSALMLSGWMKGVDLVCKTSFGDPKQM